MTADLTRVTFDQRQHYRAVQQQQGRVQLDSDWNEQVDISSFRVETETVDTVGCCGAPLHADGFRLVASAAALTPDEAARPGNASPPAVPAGDLLITAGRFYAGGILAENDAITLVSTQPEMPTPQQITDLGGTPILPLKVPGTWLAYLDVWPRLRTAIDDPHIREVALGGPDTATRLRNSWQVKFLPLPSGSSCSTTSADWDALVKPKKGTLAASVAVSASPSGPCVIDPGAGYRRLENQLYRVEVHIGGDSLAKTTFKWSRDNGSIVSRWISKDPLSDKLELESVGRDNVLNIAPGQWVELTDDAHEELGLPGSFAEVTAVVGSVITIDSANATGPVELANFPKNPKVRRWDSAPASPGKWLAPDGEKTLNTASTFELEDGVVVKFGAGSFRTGDHWLIPARTALPYVDWPTVGGTAVQRPPLGIVHQYCRLAVVTFAGGEFTITDCRSLFPPLTELISLEYVSGESQEATPNPLQPATQLLPLPLPLKVGVSNGKWPVAGARVRFTVKVGGGTLNPASGIVLTDAEGVATCSWSVNATSPSPEVMAELLDPASLRMDLPIMFHARLNTAKLVSYDPANCADMKSASVVTVQDALDFLCKQKAATASCCVTVGKIGELAGDYATVMEAFADLAKRKLSSCCVTLLPGNHVLEKDLVVGPVDDKSGTHAKLVGCGHGSRLELKGSLTFRGLASATVRDLAVTASNNSIFFAGCTEVEVSTCLIEGPGTKSQLLVLEGGARIALRDNSITAANPTDANSKAVAITLLDFTASASLVNNRIDGVLILGGTGIGTSLTLAEIKRLGELVKQNALQLKPTKGVLHLRGNAILRMAFGKELLAALKTFVATGDGVELKPWHAAQCTDNILTLGDNHVLAQHLSLGTTRFLETKQDVGLAIARTATYVGNSADNDVRLFNVSQDSQLAANIILNIAQA